MARGHVVRLLEIDSDIERLLSTGVAVWPLLAVVSTIWDGRGRPSAELLRVIAVPAANIFDDSLIASTQAGIGFGPNSVSVEMPVSVAMPRLPVRAFRLTTSESALLAGVRSAIEILARRRQPGWPLRALRGECLKNTDTVSGETDRDAGEISYP
jgi:hypothetical protein